MEKHQKNKRDKTLEIAVRQIIQDKNHEIESMRKAFLNLNDRCNLLMEENTSRSLSSIKTEDLLKIIEEKDSEIGYLNRELAAVSKKLSTRLQQEDVNKQVFDGLLSRLESESHQEKDQCLHSMRRLNDLVETLKSENKVLKSEVSSLESSHQQRIDEIRVFTKLHNEDLRKNEGLLSELSRREAALKEEKEGYEARLSESRSDLENKERELAEKKKTIENLHSDLALKQNKILTIETELQTLKELVHRSQTEEAINKETYDQMIRTLSDTITSQCDDIAALIQSSENLEKLIKAKDREMQESQEKFSLREREIIEEYETLHKKAILDPKDLELKFEAERISFRTEISHMKRTIKDLETRNTNLTNDSERQRREILSKTGEISELKKWASTKIGREEADRLKSQLEAAKKEVIEGKERILRINVEKNEIGTNLDKMIRERENMEKELKEAYGIITNLKQNQEDNQEISGLHMTVQALNEQNKRLEKECLDLKEQTEIASQEKARLLGEISIYKSKIEKSDREYTEKTLEINKKLEEVNNLQRKYDVAINTFENENRLSVLRKSVIRKE